jgi:hypothetical protein
MFEYLTTSTTQLGAYGWVFLIVQVVALLGAVYLLFLQNNQHPVQRPLLRRLGSALAILGVAGVILVIGRLLNLGVLTQRWWFYALAVIEAALAAYAIYYSQTMYPKAMAEYAARNRGRRQPARQPQVATTQRTNGTANPAPAPRPAPITSRRTSRRDRKRRDR